MKLDIAFVRYYTSWPRVAGHCLCLLACLGLCRLGVWQWERGLDKQQLGQRFVHAKAQPALSQLPRPSSQVHYRSVTLTGRYVDDIWLLDNQVRHGRVGYQAYQPFLTHAGERVMVDIGWYLADLRRQRLPQVVAQQGTQLVGRLQPFPAIGLRLGAESLQPTDWPRRVTYFTPEILADYYLKPVYTLLVNTQLEAPRLPKALPASRHFGYAVQWFSLALALLALYSWACIKVYREKHS